MGKSKIVYGGEVLIDLTADTVEEQYLLKGKTAHGADGEPITGTCEYDANTSDATAKEAEILEGKTAYVNKNKLTGSMPNNGAVSGTISTRDGKYNIPQGYHDGSGTVEINATERAKLVPANIREGITILDITGTMSGSEDEVKQSKNVTPTKDSFTVLPDTDQGFTCLSEVVVEAIPYVETPNAAGGITVTIG